MNINVSDKLIYLGAGCGIGLVIGLLFAPRSGEETRHTLTSKVDNLTHRVQEKVHHTGLGETAGQTWRNFVEKGDSDGHPDRLLFPVVETEPSGRPGYRSNAQRSWPAPKRRGEFETGYSAHCRFQRLVASFSVNLVSLCLRVFVAINTKTQRPKALRHEVIFLL